MKPFLVGEICEIISGELLSYQKDSLVEHVTIDSRTAKEGTLFFAIVGENNDGHNFVGDVIGSGCKALVVSNKDAVKQMPNENLNIILVDDTKKALQALSKHYLSQMNAKKIAVTGSVGKTTTRDLVTTICKSKYKTGSTKGNFNNQYGLPLTILGLEDDLEVIILEMGMDRANQIKILADIVKPDIGIITNIGISHLENFQSREGIRDAKMEIASFFTKENTLVVNQDSDYLKKSEITGSFDVISVGSDKSDFNVINVENNGIHGIAFEIIQKENKHKVALDIPGKHNALNATLAIAACEKIGITIEESITALTKIELTDKRLTIHQSNHITVIDDTYNACPESMKSAIDTLNATREGRTIAILGDMYELGGKEVLHHISVGEYLSQQNIDILVAVGSLGKYIAEGASNSNKMTILEFSSIDETIDELKNIIKDGDTILLKGSRGMRVDKVTQKILEEYFNV